MPAADLTGVRAKIARAKKHFGELEVAIKAWRRASGVGIYAAAEEQNSEGKRQEFVSTTVTPNPLPPDIGLVIGDVVHNLRSALDHLVCELAAARGNRAACSETQFPIFVSETKFLAAWKLQKWLPKIAPIAAEALKELQPYKRRPSDPTSDPLWVLSKLDNIDKHSTVVVTRDDLAYAAIGPGGAARIVRPIERWYREEDGTKVFGAVLPLPAAEPLEGAVTEHFPRLGLVFQQTRCCDDGFVLPTLLELVEDVERIVADFETRGFFV